MSKNKARRSEKSSKSLAITSPPSLPAYPVTRHKFRFTVGTGVTDRPIIGYDLLGLLAAATSTTACVSILQAVKLHRCTIWASNSGSTSSFVDIVWTGAYASPQKRIDISSGSAVPACTTSVPPRGSDASFWVSYLTGSATKMTLTCPVGSIIDLDCSVMFNNGGVAPTVSYVSSGLTLGQILFGPLDHNTAAPKLIPLDVTYYG